ncbi:class I SAM-dependent methyltransferase [Halodesulfovibrio marinisediminis]|uniref:Methyltransferase domain-containing protein n=1 Tax=Halodesulfovibrio marinisediminis DSM 17456 TaxID=1121457 RepID=A0A1N6HBJ4_9BACT|nr:class I SAM-dependent methyltransferase [Halodesulfovibrio marinisediminis]SIO17211.1 Methyltransferase domain-containing protein [Halodesulfovibrio marinisediminis DSM 17456]
MTRTLSQSKRTRLLKALWYMLRKPHKALKAIYRDRYDAIWWQQYVTQNYGLELGLPQINLLDLIPEFEETISPYAMLEAAATPMDIALLKGLARSFEDCDYLEIGRWRGESITNVAPHTNNCYSLSLSPEQQAQAGFSSSMIRQDGFFINATQYPNITCINCDTLSFDFSRLNKKFDLVFIDGDHHAAAVTSDTKNIFPLLKDDDSMIVWHDYANSPEKIRWAVLAGILDGLPPEEHKNLYHASNTLCAVYTRKPLSATYQEFAITPDKFFEVTIRAHRLEAPAIGHSQGEARWKRSK